MGQHDRLIDQHKDHATHHTVPIHVNIAVFLLLLILTGVTVVMAGIDLGYMNIFVAMFIASVKATVVFLWFMHLKYDNWVNRVIFGTGFFFVALFFILTASDIFSR